MIGYTQEPAPLTKRHHVVVLVHGMANFSHNRGTKREQEDLLRSNLPPDAGFLGAYDDSGNYAFCGAHQGTALEDAVLAALRAKYLLKGAIAIDRESCRLALANVERRARTVYGEIFNATDYSVAHSGARWRLGLVICKAGDMKGVAQQGLLDASNKHLEILTMYGDTVGVLKHDQLPRIPWGQPASRIEAVVRRVCDMPLATGRSARTIRGVLRLYGEAPYE